MVEGGEQETLGGILSQPRSFKEPQSNLEQTQVNVENTSGWEVVQPIPHDRHRQVVTVPRSE